MLKKKRDVFKSSITRRTVENKLMMSVAEHALQLALLFLPELQIFVTVSHFRAVTILWNEDDTRSHLPAKVYVQNGIALIMLLGKIIKEEQPLDFHSGNEAKATRECSLCGVQIAEICARELSTAILYA